jgi:hypothetical protein
MKKLGCLLLLILNVAISSFAQRAQDSLALVALYNSTGGPNWTNRTNWLSSQPISTWYGVNLSNGRVIGLRLDNNNLSGNIPIEIGNLNNIILLSLTQNNLNGNIPKEIGNLTNIKGLYFSGNLLSGAIPIELSNLSNIENLELPQNHLTGSIPKEIGTLPNLTFLSLWNNQITGIIPKELGNLKNLHVLSLSENQLSGNIPPEIWNLINLSTLNLEKNQLIGTIPSEIQNLTNLQSLDLSQNKFNGSIPLEIWRMTKFQHININWNQLTGSISPDIENLTNLTDFQLASNKLSGTIPKEIGSLTKLTALRLDDNQLSGTIPPEIWNLINLVEFGVKDNQLTGSIPLEINNLTKLTQLYLSNNKFDALSQLNFKLLLALWVQNNQLTFEDIEPNINLPIYYNPQDSIGITSDISINKGSSFTFTVSCGGTYNQYQWYKGNSIIPTATSTSYTIPSLQQSDDGSYTCAVTNTVVTGLTIYSRPIKLHVSTLTDVDELNNAGLKVYPNPTSDIINIELNENVGKDNKIDVRDIYGRIVLQKNWIDGSRHQLDLKQLPKGMYFIRIQNNNKSYIEKVIIQ